MERVFLLFMIYSFLGWVVETVYCSLLEGHFVYRGFLNGPITPIYGFGALFILYFLNDFKSNPLLLFVASVIITSALEYFSSYILETIFNMKWWDYTGRFLNINGRICLRNSLLFGILSVVFIMFIHPYVYERVIKISITRTNVMASIFFLVFITDVLFTTVNLLDLKPLIADLDRMELRFESKVRSFEMEYEVRTREYEERTKEKIKKFNSLRKNFSNKRFLDNNPDLSSKEFPRGIKNLKKLFDNKD